MGVGLRWLLVGQRQPALAHWSSWAAVGLRWPMLSSWVAVGLCWPLVAGSGPGSGRMLV